MQVPLVKRTTHIPTMFFVTPDKSSFVFVVKI